PHVASDLTNLAGALGGHGKHDRAEPLYREALTMCRQLYAPRLYPKGHAELAQSLNNLAFNLASQGKTDSAEALYRESLAMCRALYPKERYPQGHKDLAIAALNLGLLCYARGDLGAAETYCRDAQQTYSLIAERAVELMSEAEGLNKLASLPLARDAFLMATRRAADA